MTPAADRIDQATNAILSNLTANPPTPTLNQATHYVQADATRWLAEFDANDVGRDCPDSSLCGVMATLNVATDDYDGDDEVVTIAALVGASERLLAAARAILTRRATR